MEEFLATHEFNQGRWDIVQSVCLDTTFIFWLLEYQDLTLCPNQYLRFVENLVDPLKFELMNIFAIRNP